MWMDTSPSFCYGIFCLFPSPLHTEGLKRTELQLLLWIGAKREISFSWDRDVLSYRARLFLQRVHQAGEAIPLLCHTVAGKFTQLGFVVTVRRTEQAGGAGLGWDTAQVASWDSGLVLVRLDSLATRRGSWVFAVRVLAALLRIPRCSRW